jgi:ATP-dependent exoDNAse (exonuclease V) beta subunit
MIHHRGFRRFVQYWASVIEKAVDLDFFAKMRISDLVVAAEEFDSTQAPECNAFLRFIDNYSKHEESSDAAIRVMTYHQAKGLDFDMVILPDLLGNSLFKPRLQDLLVGGEPESPDWLLKAPRKAIAEGDANLSAAVNEERARRCYGELCTLYVGLTRARYALYMIGLDKAGENSISSFLCGRLAGPAGMDDSTSLRFGEYEPAAVYEQGERDWHTAIKAGKSVAEPETSHQKPVAVGQKALQRIEPSYREELNRSVSFMFDAGRRQALETGTAIHSLFEKVGWIEECNIEDMTDQWLAGEEWPEEVTRVVIPAFQKAVNSPAVAEALSRPAVNSDLWREKHFEVLLDGKLVSGVFDRVTIDYSADGKVENAQIFDFKSDRAPDEADLEDLARKYRPQLDIYDRALQKILGIDSSRVALRIIFTHAAQVVTLKSR